MAARTRQRRRRAKGALRGAGARDGGRLSSEVGNEVSLGSARVAQRRADDHRFFEQTSQARRCCRMRRERRKVASHCYDDRVLVEFEWPLPVTEKFKLPSGMENSALPVPQILEAYWRRATGVIDSERENGQMTEE